MATLVGHVGRFVRGWAPALLICGGYLTAFAVAMVTWSIVNAERSAFAMARFGETAARDIAFLAAEPLLRQDRIRLSLLAGRMVKHPEVRRIAIHTVDEQPFVVVGASAPRDASPYAKPVMVDATVVGNVRITLNADTFGLPVRQLLAETWFYWLAGLVIVAGAFQCGWLLATRLRQSRAAADIASCESAVDSDAATDMATCLLVANLFKCAGPTLDQRERVLREGLAIAEQVAASHDGVASKLPDTGLLLAFDATERNDRAFDVVCAALDLRRRLVAWQTEQTSRHEMPFDAAPLPFRYCIDATTEALGTHAQALDAEPRIRAIVLLASLARDGEIIICERAYADLAEPERLVLDDFNNPAVALVSDETPKGIVRGIAEAPP